MAYSSEWYEKNQVEQREKARVRSGRYRSLNIRFRRLYLSSRPCVDCWAPPDDDTPHEFDHRENVGAKAQVRISDLITKGTSLVRLMAELIKCDVVCAICHKRRTYDRQEWKRSPA